MYDNVLRAGLIGLGASFMASTAIAATFTASTDASALALATLDPSSGISIVSGSETYQGGDTQGGTFSDFSFSNSSTTAAIGDGVVLTTGDIGDIPGNDATDISASPGAGSDSDLQSITPQTVTNDANVLSFDFTVDPSITSVSMDFIFATDEFPDQTVTDIFGVFVDGTNFAKFNDGSTVNFDLGSPAASFFIDNDFGSADPLTASDGTILEYDGVVNKLTLTGILDAALSTHSIKIGIGDTSDTIFDSGVFFGSLKAGTATGGGGIDTGVIPLPASLPLLLAGLGGMALLRRRKA